MKWRALDIQSKIVLWIVLIVVLFVAFVSLVQYWVYHPLSPNCRGHKVSEPSGNIAYDTWAFNSIAYDVLGATWGRGNSKGCGGSDSYCLANLTAHENRRQFVEIFVHEPDAAYLSTEVGWYRYWLAPAGDSTCALFYSSKEAQANWYNWFSRLDVNPSRIDPDAICIASKNSGEAGE